MARTVFTIRPRGVIPTVKPTPSPSHVEEPIFSSKVPTLTLSTTLVGSQNSTVIVAPSVPAGVGVVKPPPLAPVGVRGTSPTCISDTQPDPINEDPPDLISATYTNDLNLIRVHEVIVARYGALRGQIPKKKNQIATLEKRLETGRHSRVSILEIETSIKSLRNEIKEIEDGTKWHSYIVEAKPLLEAYIPLMSDDARGVVKVKGRGGDKDKKDISLERQLEDRLVLIQKYLDVAGVHIPLDIVWTGAPVSRCPQCNRLFSEIPIDNDEGVHICECGYERENLTKGPSFKDSLRVNVAGRNEYEDRETFERALARHEGTYPDKIPDMLYKQLDAYFINEGFYTGAQIRALDLLPNGRKPYTSVSLLTKALSKTSNADYYKCYVLIAHNYWGWRLRDFTSIRERIMEDYDRTQAIYITIKERGSSLNVNIRVYLHLMAVDYPCEKEDFKFLQARETLLYHQRMWSEMCARTGVKYTDII